MPRSAIWKTRRQPSPASSASAAAVAMAASSNSTKGDSGTSGGFSSVRGAYEAMGAPAFYKAHGAEYTNPHAPLLFSCMRNALQRWVVPWPMPAVHVLDLACGGGEATLAFEAAMKEVITPPRAVQTEACDPYTHACYEARTGRRCHRWSFGDIANGQLDSRCSAAGPFDVVLASFCLHLLECKEDRALDNAASPRSDLKQPGPTSAPLDATLRALARVARWLLVATPHKRQPRIHESCGWVLAADEVVEHDTFDEDAQALASQDGDPERRLPSSRPITHVSTTPREGEAWGEGRSASAASASVRRRVRLRLYRSQLLS